MAEADHLQDVANAGEHWRCARHSRRWAGSFRLLLSTFCLSFSPTFHQSMLDTKLITYAPDDKIDQVVNRLGPMIEAGTSRQDNRAGLGRTLHVVDLRQRKRCLARHQNQLPPLL